MMEEKLEIILITYNRAKDLENTLNDLLKSPFSKCKITILDNCSEDKTPEICAKYEKLFPNLLSVRHEKNIGGNANILRAAETSKSIYTWIVCDDDSFDFSDCSDIIEKVEDEKTDIIIVSTDCHQYEWERGLVTTSKELIDAGSRYYDALSFVPSSIFKTELFDSECIIKGYNNICHRYPHFEFINKSVEKNFSIYISKAEIIKINKSNQASFSTLIWYTSWLNSCSTIKNKTIRKKVLHQSAQKDPFITMILWNIVHEKITRNNQKSYIEFLYAYMLSFGLSRELLLLFLIIPALIVPSFFYKQIRRTYLNIRYGKKELKKRNEVVFVNQEDRFW